MICGRDRNLLIVLPAAATQLWLLMLAPLYCAAWPAALRWTTTLLAVLLTMPYWALLHEAIHSNLLTSRPWNNRLGRILAILFGAPFEALRFGHLLHHRFNRGEEVSEGYDTAATPWANAALRHYAQILGGLYWAEVLLGGVVWLPGFLRDRIQGRLAPPGRMAMLFRERINQPPVLAELRRDGLASVGLLAVAFALYGHDWPVLLAALCGRALLISFFDNAYHYGTATGHPELARNHAFPGNAAALVLNFNYHGVHHLYPALPWYELPEKARIIAASFEGGFFSAPLRQLLGPIPLSRLAALR